MASRLTASENKEANLAVLNDVLNPVLIINPDTSIRYVNPALEELTGFTSAELVGTKAPYPWWAKSRREKHTKRLMSIMRRIMKCGEKTERNNVSKDGKQFWVQIASKPVFVDSEFKYFISNWVDITERKKAERQRNKLNKELRYLSQHLQDAREQERAQIARQVHDELGQSLTALKMDVCWLEKKLSGEPEKIRETIRSTNKLIDDTLQTVKWISSRLRPSLLDDIGLSDAIEWQASQFQILSGITCHVHLSQECNNLDRQQSLAIYRVFQEALTNIFSHAQANDVSVILRKTLHHLILEIRDNGKGITQEQLSDPRAFGLIGMREAVHACGGKLKITGVRGKGTTINVRVPLERVEGTDA